MTEGTNPAMDPLVGALVTRMFEDSASTTGRLMDGYEREIRDFSQVLLGLYDVVMEDPNLTVRMARQVDRIALGSLRGAEGVVARGYYANREFAKRNPGTEES